MKKLVNYSMILMICMTLLGIQSCQEELGNDSLSSIDENSQELKSASMNTFYSSTLPVGNGVARAWIKVNKNGNPLEVGINLSGKALEKLPDEVTQYVLTLPKNKGQNFFTHVLLDWNPHGHEGPNGIYEVPHFDFHFYTIPSEERMLIPLLVPVEPIDAEDFDTPPADMYVPPLYVQIPGIVPEMGAHWADVTSPEFHGEPFTHTFILGSYNGEFIFWEPMITMDYLLTQPDEVFPVRQPSAFKRDGWYPTDYKISYSSQPDEYSVALMNLTYHLGE